MSQPQKLIKEFSDMDDFLRSPARHRLVEIIDGLARSVTGYETPDQHYSSKSSLVRDICIKFAGATKIIEETPPVDTPQRFGNPSYRCWLEKVKPIFRSGNDELDHYIFNSFGSAQRIDFGTGHELNFIAYWDGSLRLNNSEEQVTGQDILLVYSEYFELCRRLITTYQLEPAGSHGVWGLDDHFHLPYILGAAQLSHLSPDNSPKPKDVLNSSVVNEQKSSNLYFAAIAFICRVKTGPFFEHSPILFDVSSIKNWSKVLSGMVKMYHGEVLSKFPVVQHFYFGTLFPYKPTTQADQL